MPFNAIRQQNVPSYILGISEATGDTHASVMTQLTPFVNRRMGSSQMKVCVLRENHGSGHAQRCCSQSSSSYPIMGPLGPTMCCLREVLRKCLKVSQ